MEVGVGRDGGKSEEGAGIGQKARGSRERFRNSGRNGWCRENGEGEWHIIESERSRKIRSQIIL